jgi:catechol 2,3-dioxygenase-like lactoylglutathione lyase family enzyme
VRDPDPGARVIERTHIEESAMSTTQTGTIHTSKAGAISCDMALEVVVIPVSDCDQSKTFFSNLGWRFDADIVVGDDLRIIQFTPPGSGCSIQFGRGVTEAKPGTARHIQLVVSDIDAAHRELIGKGCRVSGCFHGSPFSLAGRIDGPDPNHQSYSSYTSFEDPDGNAFVLQEVTQRLPGRVDPGETKYVSISNLADAMRRASEAHGKHEERIGGPDADWPDWYAKYMAAEQSGSELPV